MGREPAHGPVRLERSFFARPALTVAPELLGCRITHAGVTVRLTEAEAYAGEGVDPGSHAYRGRTPRTEVMFGEAGHLYVYFSYGMHWCANVVCGDDGEAQAVLLRAGEVVDGRGRRLGPTGRGRTPGLGARTGTSHLHAGDRPRPRRARRLCAGAGEVRPPTVPVVRDRVRTGPRVGVSGPGGDGTAYPWRFWIDADPTVSAYRPGVIRRRSR